LGLEGPAAGDECGAPVPIASFGEEAALRHMEILTANIGTPRRAAQIEVRYHPLEPLPVDRAQRLVEGDIGYRPRLPPTRPLIAAVYSPKSRELDTRPR
jgi:hypothetical protein